MKKLNDQKTFSKMYWLGMETFVNGKTPIIPPLLVNDNLTSNNIFNDFFVQQCRPIANNSILPTNQIFYTQNRLRGFDIDSGKI